MERLWRIVIATERIKYSGQICRSGEKMDLQPFNLEHYIFGLFSGLLEEKNIED